MTDHPKDGGPAFPEYIVSFDGGGEISGGMTLRAYAAIQLRQPDSGIDWLDDMIRSARRDDLAGRALTGIIAHHQNKDAEGGAFFARVAYQMADAMPAMRKEY